MSRGAGPLAANVTEKTRVPWSAKLGRFAGIDVYVHATFLLLLAWVVWRYWSTTGTLAGAGAEIALVLLLFLCVLLHEYGHALTARRFGIGTRSITLLPIGGLALLERMPRDPRQEILVALAGPAVNLVIAALLYLLLLAGGTGGAPLHLVSATLLPTLIAANLVLAIFNLLPAFPMDGGRVLRAALAMRMDRVRATRLAARIGQGLAVGLGILGLMGNPVLLLIAVFVWIGAGAEAGAVAVDDSLARQTAGRAMVTDFRTLAPDDPLSHAVELTLSGTQKDFPVLDGDRLAGVITQASLLRALRDFGAGGPVRAAMAAARTADVATPLADLLGMVQGPETRLVCITRAGRLVGIVDLENIAEFLRIRQALAGR
jgi:Zn-dependent protease/CBS domain-containing protein